MKTKALFRVAAVAFTLAILGTGCGKQGSEEPNRKVITAKDLADAQRIALLTQVTCFSAADCDPSVAMLAAAWPTSVTVCTSFLVAPDVLATNAHCLPDDLGHPGAACEGRIWGFFPAVSGSGEEKVECESVISTSGHSEATPGQDLAFLKLKTASTRPDLRLSREGFPDHQKFSVVKINPDDATGYAVGTMQKVTCETIQHMAKLPSFDNAKGPVVSFSGCEIVHGNSGSPIIDSRGNVRGIVQAVFNTGQLSRQALLDGTVDDLSMGTNMACARTPLDGGVSFPSSCNDFPGTRDEEQSQAWANRVDSRIQENTDHNIGVWESGNSTGYQWAGGKLALNSTLIPGRPTATRTEWDLYAVASPKCVTSQAQEGTRSILMPVYQYRRGYTKQMIFDFAYKGVADSLPATITLANDSSGNSTVELVVQDSAGHSVVLYQRQIPRCR